MLSCFSMLTLNRGKYRLPGVSGYRVNATDCEACGKVLKCSCKAQEKITPCLSDCVYDLE